MAVRGLVVTAVVVSPRLGIEQDGGNHRLHIAPYATSVIGESRGNPLDVGRAWIAFYQMTYQKLADQPPPIWMVETFFGRLTQILLRAQARGLRVAVDQLLRSRVMFRRIRN